MLSSLKYKSYYKICVVLKAKMYYMKDNANIKYAFYKEEFAKLRALRVQRTYVPTCLTCLRAHVPACLPCLRAL